MFDLAVYTLSGFKQKASNVQLFLERVFAPTFPPFVPAADVKPRFRRRLFPKPNRLSNVVRLAEAAERAAA